MPKKTRVITCEECGASRSTRASNTKRCRVCSTLRQLLFYQDKSKLRKCVECECDFMPVFRGDSVCGDCDTSNWARASRGQCGTCHQENVFLWDHNIKVCMPCMRNPKLRRTLIRALQKKQDDLKAGTTEYINVS